MKPNNYATLEASKHLVDAGIVLETEKVWATDGCDWMLGDKKRFELWLNCIPAPSMAEVWRELPNGSFNCIITNDPFYSFQYKSIMSSQVNPTDALIDLLILGKKEVRDEKISG